MRQLPKAIPELDGGLFLPRQVVDLLEATLNEHEQMLQGQLPEENRAVLGELRELLRLTGARPQLPAAREQLGMADPHQEMLARNLMRC